MPIPAFVYKRSTGILCPSKELNCGA